MEKEKIEERIKDTKEKLEWIEKRVYEYDIKFSNGDINWTNLKNSLVLLELELERIKS